jgi:uncharacterized membrane protein
MIHLSLDYINIILIEKLYLIHNINILRIQYLITKVWIKKKTEQADIICNYSISTNTKLKIIIYNITIKGLNLIINLLVYLKIRLKVNKKVKV